MDDEKQKKAKDSERVEECDLTDDDIAELAAMYDEIAAGGKPAIKPKE